ncbi:unnamed protein product [Brassica rapa]|uniref:Uncharacterized protein n=1 Tax=Brassica campestris TaxID=3711 RepID=A0A8D9G125_BRACM|nr:unnamed protein product [Brassica rapa]
MADTPRRPVSTDTHGRPVCAGGHPQTSFVRPVCADGHPRTSYSPRGPKSPKQSTGRASVLSPRTNVLICVLMDSHGRPVTNVLICVLMDSHGRPVCADGHSQTHMDSHGRPVCADGHPRTQPTWAKITQTVHGKGQRAKSKDQRADMSTDVLCVLTDTHGHTRTARDVLFTDVLCVLTESHRQPRTSCMCWWTPTDVLCVLNIQPTWAKITQTSPGRASVLSPRTNVLICVLMDSHGRPVHGRPVCAVGQPQTSYVCRRTPTDILCVLNRQPTCAQITQTVHEKGQGAESKDQRADMCTDGQPQTSYTDGHTRTATDILCVLADTHRRPVHTRTYTDSHRRPVCADGQPQRATDVMYSPRGPKSPKQSTGRASVLSPGTNVLICVLMDSHGRHVCADRHRRTHTDSHEHPVCAGGHPRTQPTWAKITRTVQGKGQRSESKDQHADMSTDVLCVLTDTQGHTWTATDVLCVLTDTHGHPMCADRHPRTSCVHRQPWTSCICWRTPTDVLSVLNRQPTWAKITQTVPGKGQRVESKDQRADMCTDGQPRTQPTWAKITRTVHGKSQCAESKDQRADMCTDGQPQTSCVC